VCLATPRPADCLSCLAFATASWPRASTSHSNASGRRNPIFFSLYQKIPPCTRRRTHPHASRKFAALRWPQSLTSCSLLAEGRSLHSAVSRRTFTTTVALQLATVTVRGCSDKLTQGHRPADGLQVISLPGLPPQAISRIQDTGQSCQLPFGLLAPSAARYSPPRPAAFEPTSMVIRWVNPFQRIFKDCKDSIEHQSTQKGAPAPQSPANAMLRAKQFQVEAAARRASTNNETHLETTSTD